MTSRRRASSVLLVGLVAVGCTDPRTGTSSTSGPGMSPSAQPLQALPGPVATSKERKRCVVYEATPDFGAEWEVKESRDFECYRDYDLWARDRADGKPADQREEPDVVVRLCDWSSSGYDPLDRTDRKSRGKRVKVLLPTAFINAEIEKNERLEFSGQLEVERKYDEGVSGVLVARFKNLTLTQLGSLLEALTQAPGQPWPDQSKFHRGFRCALFTTSDRSRWDLLQLLAP